MSEEVPKSKREAEKFLDRMAMILILTGAKGVRRDDVALPLAVRHALERGGFGVGDPSWDEIAAFLPNLDELLEERDARIKDITKEQVASQRDLMRAERGRQDQRQII